MSDQLITRRKAVWSTATINDLPDSAFLYIESGGKKDGGGKTAPRSKRHFPYKDASGKIDLPHLRNAIARIPQSNAPGLNKDALQARARKLLGVEHKARRSRLEAAKESMYGMPEKNISGKATPSRPVVLPTPAPLPESSRPKKRSGSEGTWARRKRHAAQRAAQIASGGPVTRPSTRRSPKPPKSSSISSSIGKPRSRSSIIRSSIGRRKEIHPSISRSKSKSDLLVFKQKDGTMRWVMYSSNPYKDRDDEFVTQKAHDGDIEYMDNTGDYGPLRWWHAGEPYFEDEDDWTTVRPGPGVDIGVCDFAAMHGRIRVESGTFKSEKVGIAIANHVSELEGSLAFAHPRSEPDEGGGFLHIKSFERSLTPLNQASNLFTSLLVGKKRNDMDNAKLKALKDLGVDVDEVLDGAENIQRKADKSAPYRMKSSATRDIVEEEFEVEEDDEDLAGKLDRLTAQIASMQEAMKESDYPLEEAERLEDLMVGELTVGELQDIIGQTISTKSLEPTGIVLKSILEELDEIKSILTSKSVQSVVDEVARMKAKLERQSARLKATASKVRELDDEKPRIFNRGIRPSESVDTLFGDDDGDIAQKTSSNPFSWIDELVHDQQK